ncbi:carbohydrate binding domain-containing protein [Aquimarina agarivorans]|uniref:carbohydrate binding domain-containing protein n=1 Tax=Aquimarina agarivorans TaxID=980584 RepID=UPI000248E734|nr:carbohydrate binding domain-containing protein [Aquimarina agarivorans]
MKTTLFFLILPLLTTKAQNLIENSSFDNGTKNWQFIVKNNNQDDIALEANFKSNYERKAERFKKHAKIEVISIGKTTKHSNVILQQKVEGLKKNKRYNFSVWIRSRSRNNDKLTLNIISAPTNTGSKLPQTTIASTELKYKCNGIWQQANFEFETRSKNKNKLDLKNTILQIGFGHRIGDFYIDSIEVIRN